MNLTAEKKEQHVRKPEWLKIKLGSNEHFTHTKETLDSCGLNTICSSGMCPNMGECFSRGTATFMIGGSICTRSCRFCATQTGIPLPLRKEEPVNVALSIKLMGLKHAVITSVDRDDLPDYGAEHWAKTIRSIRKFCPQTTIEVLIPDFNGREDLVSIVAAEKPEIISHNMETVKRLSPSIRSRATYETSLRVLSFISKRKIVTKTGIMVGLGETEEEVLELMDDVLGSNAEIITIGQYLRPTRRNAPVREYVHPDQFARYKEIGLKKGFRIVESAPLVRSSYHADAHVANRP